MESKSSTSTPSSAVKDHGGTAPRAVLHKKILDAAEARPDASMEDIAESVSGATLSIVEQVLEEYGDPGATDGTNGDTATDEVDEMESGTSVDEPDDEPPSSDSTEPETDESASTTASTTTTPIQPAALTAKQRETLREIARRPTATQATLADELGVTSATISQRVNSIEGFDWSDRRAFVDGLFEDDTLEETRDTAGDDETPSDGTREGANADGCTTTSSNTEGTMRPTDSDEEPSTTTNAVRHAPAGEQHSPPSLETFTALTERLEALNDHLDRLEERCVALESDGTGSSSPIETGLLSDPELTHKVLHACLRAETISEEEELRLLKLLTAAETDAE